MLPVAVPGHRAALTPLEEKRLRRRVPSGAIFVVAATLAALAFMAPIARAVVETPSRRFARAGATASWRVCANEDAPSTPAFAFLSYDSAVCAPPYVLDACVATCAGVVGGAQWHRCAPGCALADLLAAADAEARTGPYHAERYLRLF